MAFLRNKAWRRIQYCIYEVHDWCGVVVLHNKLGGAFSIEFMMCTIGAEWQSCTTKYKGRMLVPCVSLSSKRQGASVLTLVANRTEGP
eukprot:998755-Pelagomonas_calceolata.AAC.1